VDQEEQREARKAVGKLEAEADRGDNAEALYQMARVEWRNGFRGAAMQRLKRACKMGHIKAQARLQSIANRRSFAAIKKQIKPSGAR
jgi:hypothetical protein